MYYVYILKSLKDGGAYVGISKDVAVRLKSHNSGGTQSTKSRRPFVVVHSEIWMTRKEARNREKWLKSYAGSFEKRDILDKHCQIV